MNESNEIGEEGSENNDDVIEDEEEQQEEVHNEEKEKPSITENKPITHQSVNKSIKNEKIVEEENEEEKEDQLNVVNNEHKEEKEIHDESQKEVEVLQSSQVVDKLKRENSLNRSIKTPITTFNKKDTIDETSINIELKNKNEFVGMEHFDEASRVGFGVNDDDNMSFSRYMSKPEFGRKKTTVSNFNNGEKELICEDDINKKIDNVLHLDNTVLHLDNKTLLYQEVQNFKTWKKFTKDKLKYYLPDEYEKKVKEHYLSVRKEREKKMKNKDESKPKGFKRLAMKKSSVKKKSTTKNENTDTNQKPNFENEYHRLLEEITNLKNENKELKNRIEDIQKSLKSNPSSENPQPEKEENETTEIAQQETAKEN